MNNEQYNKSTITMEKYLDKAFKLAKEVHYGQVYNLPDKTVDFFHYHIMNVYCRVAADPDADSDMLIVAVLHDVLEDSDQTQKNALIQKIRVEFGNHILEALLALDRTDCTDYSFYIEMVEKNHLARLVKIHDLKENLYHCLLPDANKHAREKLYPRYIKALAILSKNK